MKREDYAKRRAAALIKQIQGQPLSKAIEAASHALYVALAWHDYEVPDEFAERLTW
jgi:hypothetical protein